jgi:hypothetical protein
MTGKSTTTIKPKPPDLSPGHHEKWRACRLCIAKWKTAELKFDSGSTVPVVGETLTGATSSDTGVVIEIETLLSGTWAGGDAAGYLTMDTISQDDSEQLSIFTDNENINGSTGGSNILTADGQGNVKIWALMYPKRLTVKYEGQYLCVWHYHYRARMKELDRERLIIREDERGRE